LSSFFAYLAKSGLCLALGYGVYWLVLKKETYFALNRAYLLGTALLSLVLPLFRISSPFLTTVVTSAAPAASPALPAVAAQAPAVLDPWRAILLVYLAGVGLLASRFAFWLARLARAVQKGGGERRDGFRVVVSDHPGGPFSFFNVIFLDRSGGPARDWRRILAHEMAHVRQLHTVDIIVSECLAILQWFNPFVWPYRDSLRETHEYLADRAAIAQGGSLAGYQLLILEQSVGGKLLGLASSFRTSQVKRRLQMLTRKKSKGWTRVKPLLILPLAALLLLAFAEAKVVVQPGPEAVLPQTKTASNPPAHKEMSEEEIIKALKEKSAKLAQMREENKAKIAELKAALESSTDGDKARLKEELKAAEITSLEIDRKEIMLHMKKLELAMGKETDPAKLQELKKKGAELKAKDVECAQKLAELKPADAETKKK
jgi:BlaR1 peptidase M56